MTKWFGEPWPPDWRVNGRAPVCEDDEDQVPIPVDSMCGECWQRIQPDAQGVILPYVHSSGERQTIVYHLLCLLQMLGLRGVGDSVYGAWNIDE